MVLTSVIQGCNTEDSFRLFVLQITIKKGVYHMGRVRNLRLPDEMEDDLDKYLVDNKVKFTDLVISAITPVIYEQGKKQPCKDMPEPAKSAVASPCEPDIGKDTIYEPDPIRPVKIKRRSVSKAVAPVVSALLSNVKARPTVSHHPQCKCGMCLIYKQP
jgi:hypothetical protein